MYIPTTILTQGGAGSQTQIYDSLLSGTAANFDITSIAQTGNALLIILHGRADAVVTTQNTWMRVNNDSSAIYSYIAATGSGSGGFTALYISESTGANATAAMPSTHIIYIPNYTGTAFIKHATVLAAYLNEGVTSNQTILTAFYSSASAITRLTLYPNAGSWIAGSRCTAYLLS